MDMIIVQDGKETSLIGVENAQEGMNMFYVSKGINKSSRSNSGISAVYEYDHDHPNEERIPIENWENL